MTRTTLEQFTPHTRARIVLAPGALFALAACFAGCFGSSGGDPSGSSATNFLDCDTVDDCDHPDAVACDAAGRCLDARGEPIPDPTRTMTGGSGGNAGSGGAGGAGSGGSGGAGAGGVGGTGGSDGSRDCAGVDCGAGSHCCADCGDHQCLPDGTGCPDLSCPVAACVRAGDECCDPFPADGPNYCEGSLTCCADNTCATSCDGTPPPDLTGTVECGSETCGAGQVCAHPCCGGDGSPCTPLPMFCVDYAEACTGDFCSTMSCTGDLDGRAILCTCA